MSHAPDKKTLRGYLSSGMTVLDVAKKLKQDPNVVDNWMKYRNVIRIPPKETLIKLKNKDISKLYMVSNRIVEQWYKKYKLPYNVWPSTKSNITRMRRTGITYEQIADKYSVPVNTVKKHMSKPRKPKTIKIVSEKELDEFDFDSLFKNVRVKYDNDTKKHIIQIYKQGNTTLRKLSETFNIPQSTIGSWIQRSKPKS